MRSIPEVAFTAIQSFAFVVCRKQGNEPLYSLCTDDRPMSLPHLATRVKRKRARCCCSNSCESCSNSRHRRRRSRHCSSCRSESGVIRPIPKSLYFGMALIHPPSIFPISSNFLLQTSYFFSGRYLVSGSDASRRRFRSTSSSTSRSCNVVFL